MVVEMEHRMDRMVAQRVGGENTLAVFVGILCSGNRLREINHRVVRERLSCREPQSKKHGEIRAKKRPGP